MKHNCLIDFATRLAKGGVILLAAAFLASCGMFTQSTPQALPTVVLDQPGTLPAASSAPTQIFSGGVTASGTVNPAQQAQLVPAMGGVVLAVKVQVGDTVKSGQVLLTLAGGEKLAAGVQSAQVELLSAQQALQTLRDNAGQDRANAVQRLANAQKALEDAQKIRTWRNYRNGSDAQIDSARADVVLAKDNLTHAQEFFSSFASHPEDDLNRAAALSALSAAENAYNRAVGNLNYLLAMPNALEVNQADANLLAAQAEADSAQRQVDALKDGPDPAEAALAEARIQNAQAQLTASQAALADLQVKAPFDGTISQVMTHSGEWVVPGQPVLALADLEHLQVQTTDLSERDVPNVSVGQAVQVDIKALGQQLSGKVVQIAPLADTLGGDVVYQTTIELSSIPANLRAGMSVEVHFGE